MNRVLLISVLLVSGCANIDIGDCLELADGSGEFARYEAFQNYTHYIRLENGELTAIAESDFIKIDCDIWSNYE